MKKFLFLSVSALLLAACSSKPKTAEVVEPKLCDAFPDYTIGVALNVNQSNEKDAEAELQKIHDKYIKKLDELMEAKNKEIMTV